MTDAATNANYREYTLTRTFDAPPELVFKAWTDPAHFASWWGGAHATTPVDTMTMDVRPGGEWSSHMRAGDGTEHPFSGYFREIVPNERLVMTLTDKPSPDPNQEHLLTITFKDLGGRTEMHFTQAGDFGEDPDGMIEGLDHGYPAFFDALAGTVEKR